MSFLRVEVLVILLVSQHLTQLFTCSFSTQVTSWRIQFLDTDTSPFCQITSLMRAENASFQLWRSLYQTRSLALLESSINISCIYSKNGNSLAHSFIKYLCASPQRYKD